MEILKYLQHRDVAQVPHTCPHCGVLSQHQKSVIEGFATTKSQPVQGGSRVFTSQQRHFLLRCLNCSKYTYVLYEPVFKNGDLDFPGSEASILHTHPVATPISSEAVPTKVRDAAIEAEKCLSVGANNACGVMTRRAMHALCEEKGGTGRDLFAQLSDLKDRHLITPDLWEWAEELRILGRNGAHPDWPEVTPEDADYGVKFLREIVRYLYINPHERSQRRLKETSRKE